MGGAPGGPLLPRPPPLLGSILLINTGSGTGLWLFSLVGEEGWGCSPCPDSAPPAPHPHPVGPDHQFPRVLLQASCHPLIPWLIAHHSPYLAFCPASCQQLALGIGKTVPQPPQSSFPCPRKQQKPHPSCLHPGALSQGSVGAAEQQQGEQTVRNRGRGASGEACGRGRA